MQSSLKSPTLVLNKNWRPIGIESVKKSVKRFFTGSRRFVNPETYEVYDLQEWLEKTPQPDQPYVVCAKRLVIAPEIVLLTSYDDMPRNEVRLTRRNVLVRDNFRCQYCNTKVARPIQGAKVRKLSEYTWDHVTPRSLGGKTIWTNIVTACFRCNTRKSNKTLEQAGLTLLKKPERPKWSLSLIKHVSQKPASWDKFLTKEMWSSETFAENDAE